MSTSPSSTKTTHWPNTRCSGSRGRSLSTLIFSSSTRTRTRSTRRACATRRISNRTGTWNPFLVQLDHPSWRIPHRLVSARRSQGRLRRRPGLRLGTAIHRTTHPPTNLSYSKSALSLEKTSLSTARGGSEKSYALPAGQRVFNDHFARVGISASARSCRLIVIARDIEFPTLRRWSA